MNDLLIDAIPGMNISLLVHPNNNNQSFQELIKVWTLEKYLFYNLSINKEQITVLLRELDDNNI